MRPNLEKIEKSNKLSDEEKEKYIADNREKLKKIEYEKKDLAFSIHGENLHLPIKKEITEDGNYRFRATKLISFKNIIKKDSLRLVKGRIEFKNGLISERVARELGDIVEDDDSYLKTWDKYIEKEGEILLEKAKKVGVLKTLTTKRVDNGYELKIENFSDIGEFLNEGDYLNIVDEIPDYINNNLTWIEHIAQLEKPDEMGVKPIKKKL